MSDRQGDGLSMEPMKEKFNERAVALIVEELDAIRPRFRHGEILPAVAGEVARDHPDRPGSCGQDLGDLEVSPAVALENHDVVGQLVDHDEVEMAIAAQESYEAQPGRQRAHCRPEWPPEAEEGANLKTPSLIRI